VRAAFAQLRPDEQELLELRVLGRLDSRETAALLGKKPGAVRMAQSRALERLRTLMQEAVRA
jgi:RNA polymerase sigma-70 factor (ECF subfamily)